MTKFALAAALTLIAGSAFAQEAPFWIVDGAVVYTGQTMSNGTTFEGGASATASPAFMLDGGNINWDQNYSGK
ncbi:hypothetical protein [Mesorhizobium australicum]|uniref:Uncharacterized protein n=1 Tax=Mesorhizobium australicum TaxID=536018 RepID=A0A1X7NMY7_9HYPH|nr:hypothetical protein [Mesorhizobium australicum]SMH39374.1 hypothetical protein SAMN02982922_2162 [Mesorhizobium australicum]